MSYPDFNKAIELCRKTGIGCKLSKSDMTSAFRNLGIKKEHWKWLVLMAVFPIDGKTYYFIDKCLPFGALISCAHFQEFSNAITHVVKVKSGKDNINYLDNFMFIAMLKALCDGQVNLFTAICNRINFPVSLDKTFYSSTCMVFLGLLIDTVAQLVMIPGDKIEKGIELLTNALAKVSGKITVKECQWICGFLNFLGRAIVPGRAFTRHLYSLTANPNLNYNPRSKSVES